MHPKGVTISDHREMLPGIAISYRPARLVDKSFHLINHPSATCLDEEHGMTQHPIVPVTPAIITYTDRIGARSIFRQERTGNSIRMLRHAANNYRVIVGEEFAKGKIQIGVTTETYSKRSSRHIIAFPLLGPGEEASKFLA
jgi:hypothetical protein